ncbi:transcriptional repressor LexA [Intestinibacillus massiliensis]|uniref:transcriptional repressor LexA n=1 Tax=Intestinibacillus massiliensis TaxID=1871029 RepID=UPI000B35C3F0|nr:transcriptional repressor LexA [Intestinibacillus massiliensis]
MKKISAKQQKILEYIAEFTAQNGYPPSVREIGAEVGLRSPSTVHAHLKTLRDLGYLEKGDHKTRALSIRGTAGAVQKVPILGQVTAGMPILAVEQIEGYLPMDLTGKYGEHFALRIRGESMIGAGILDGDLIVVRKQETARSGQIVVALLEDEATCKRLKLEDGEIWLMPENPAFPPIDGTGCTILGVVVAAYRQYQA